MTSQQVKETVANSPLTTVAGTLTSVSAIVVALVPGHVWEVCSAEVAKTSNPVVVGSMLGVGILLNTIGPSLVRKR